MTVHQIHRALLALAAAILLAAVVVATAQVAGAETQPEPVACSAQVELVERIYERPTYTTEHEVAKHTRERTKDRGQWSDWSTPEVWTPLSHEAWVTDLPAPVWQPHASGYRWERQWAVLPTGLTRETETGVESSGWTTDTLESPWTLVDERTTTVDGDRVPCDPQPPADGRNDETTDVDCESGLVTTVTRTWETPYVLVGWEWQPGVEVLVAEVSSQHAVAPADCPTPEPPVEPPVYECDGDGDGVPEHSYEDPTDGICAEQAPPPVEPPVEPVVLAAMDTLPVTGIDRWVLPLAWGLLFVGGGLWICARYSTRES